MNEQAIRKLRRKFILSAFLSFLTVMLLMGGLIYFINLHSTEAQIYKTLDFIAENNGDIFKGDHNHSDEEETSQNEEDYLQWLLNDLFHTGMDSSPEFRYMIRYFAVVYGEDQTEIKTNYIAAVDSDEAMDYADSVAGKGRDYGKTGNYYYHCADSDDGKIVVFLDCSAQLANVGRLMNIVLLLIALGALASFILVRIISRRMIQPEIRYAERQKQFITNAGHELKTPLSVIRANTELDIMLNGENDWNQSTLRQVDHMTGLIQNLITIARAEEKEKEESLSDVNVSRLAAETASNFEPVAVKDGKTLETELAEDVIFRADESKIRQLITLLTDNAIKYCDDGGKIRITLSQKGKNIILSVFNDYKNGENVDCSRFFERFYREDQSHNIDKGGYGIGLSIAEGIVRRYHGTISANWNNGIICFKCVMH